MRRLRALIMLPLLVLGATHCASSPRDPDDPSLLERPFTAAQIAAAMPEGTVLEFELSMPMGKERVRWTVVTADEAGCEIESVALDGAGSRTGNVERRRNTWTELRKHASFPAETSSVEPDRRLTPLGLVEGWTYTTRDEETGTLARLFFSPLFPGPPLWLEVTKDGQLVRTVQQTSRR